MTYATPAKEKDIYHQARSSSGKDLASLRLYFLQTPLPLNKITLTSCLIVMNIEFRRNKHNKISNLFNLRKDRRLYDSIKFGAPCLK